jgi:hypothetical protein
MRPVLVALLFVLAQAGPGLHAALEENHEPVVHACCPDGSKPAHFETCGEDHEHAECPVCTVGRGSLSTAVDPAPVGVEVAELPSSPEPDSRPADPFHVEIPDSRGPPA